MRVIVDYPVRASGRPKGHSGNKVIVGCQSAEFELAVNDEPMVKAIELKSQYGTLVYLQNGDGHSYMHTRARGPVTEGHHFVAQYDASGHPFIEDQMKLIRQEFHNRSKAEIKQHYFPDELHSGNRYSHSRLLNLGTAVIENLEIRDGELAKARTQKTIEQYVLSQGVLYKRVPEPCYSVSLSEQKVWIRHMIENDFDVFEKVLRTDKSVVASFDLSDIERVEDFARELASDTGSEFEGKSFTYDVEYYSPFSSYADELTLYRIGRHIEHSVVDNMGRGADRIEKLLSWNNESLGLLRDLTTLINKRDWMNESPALERVIGSCLEYDRANRSRLFTKQPLNEDQFDFNLAYSQWQMREFSAPSLRR